MAVTYSAAFARGYLRARYAEAQAAGKPLLTMLLEASNEAQAALAGGKALIGTAANGRTATFQVEGVGVTPRDIAELTSRLLDSYDTVAASLGTGATDATVYAGMLDTLRPITRVRSAFYSLTR